MSVMLLESSGFCQVVYTSSSNSLRLSLIAAGNADDDNGPYFALKYDGKFCLHTAKSSLSALSARYRRGLIQTAAMLFTLRQTHDKSRTKSL